VQSKSEPRTRIALVENLGSEDFTTLRDALLPTFELVTVTGGAQLKTASAVILRDGELTSSTLHDAPRLRFVIRLEAGQGGVDENACKARRIAIEVIPSLADISVAEHTIMVILMLFKRVDRASDALRSGTIIPGVSPTLTTQDQYAFNWVGLDGYDSLWGQTIGLIGLGRIGSHVARLLNALGARVSYFKRSRLKASDERRMGVYYLPLDELLKTADCVSLHNRWDAASDSMMNARSFALMPSGALFVNTARGRLVNEDDLTDALSAGQLGGAALDVFETEPLAATSPLLDVPNLIMTPHTAGISYKKAQERELQEAARRITLAFRSASARTSRTGGGQPD
jgi:phosphoglycerate dehydrogenase-like enzyme